MQSSPSWARAAWARCIARDTKLNRDVALKVLLPAVANDPERLARFSREAQVLASLNHPHIAAIGLEDAGETKALVMELVDGEDLSQRLARGPLPLKEALPIARQIADALDAAHEQGIVHRDLKPANIKVRPDGTVKVLDFGLAKAMEAPGSGLQASGPAVTQSPTITSPAMTQAGIILGTAAYMSPEQAEGQPVDQRSDLWAFGVVLFEMLTARPVFEGDTISRVLASVLKDEPKWASLPAGTPEPVRTLLRRCLQKDRRRRLASAADARLEIEDAMHAPAVEAAPAPHATRRGGRLAWSVAAAALVALALVALWPRAQPATTTAEARFEIVTPATTDPGSIALSPDGQHIAFVATSDAEPMLWVRSLATGEARALKGTDRATLPFWAPDGRSLAFFADRTLRRVDVQGTTVVDVAPAAVGSGGTWHREGGILYAATATGRIVHLPPERLAARSGTSRDTGTRDGATASAVSDEDSARVTTMVPGQAAHVYPDWLPDGRHFIYLSAGTAEGRGVWMASLDGGPARRLVDAEFGRIAPPSTLLFVRQNTLLAQPIAADYGSLTGEPVAVASLDGMVIEGGLSTSVSGAVAWRHGARQQTQYRWFDRAGRPDASTPVDETELAGASSAALSPDRRYLAVDQRVAGNWDVWITDLSRGVRTRLTTDPALDRFPTWTPDGRTIVFASTRGGARWDLVARPAFGEGKEELLLSTPNTKHPLEVSRDGRVLLYHEASGTDGGMEVWVLSLRDRSPTRVVSPARRGTFSPDGRWLAYESAVSGRNEIYLQPFPGPGERIQVSRSGAAQARWRDDGRELYYVGLDRRLMAVPVRLSADGRTAALGAEIPLFVTRLRAQQILFGARRVEYLASPDGQRFLINAVPDEDVPVPIRMVLNWRPPTP